VFCVLELLAKVKRRPDPFFYDAEIAKDPDAVKAIGEYLSMTSRMEKAADTILKKLMELHNKYKTTQIQIESFNVNFPLISIDIQFKFKTS